MFGKAVILTALIFHSDCFLTTNNVDVNDVSDLLKPINYGDIPNNYDWREYKMVSPVKDQGECNVCWAFSIVANIESHLKIYYKVETVLSEQFLIDCTPNKGCNDEISVVNTLSYIVTELGGILKDQDYFKYDANKHSCRWKQDTITNQTIDARSCITGDIEEKNPNPSVVRVIGFRMVKQDEDILADFVYRYGPITAGINSNSMQKYTNGIDEPTDEECDPNHQDHNVLIVGFSAYVDRVTNKVTPYWIIKNSWGEKWGDHGYYYLVRGRNACGIANNLAFGMVN